VTERGPRGRIPGQRRIDDSGRIVLTGLGDISPAALCRPLTGSRLPIHSTNVDGVVLSNASGFAGDDACLVSRRIPERKEATP
jgi:hypothetical protein